MRLESVTISNFKNYYEPSPVELGGESKTRNLILIGGKNGFGKSTFCEAVRLCLFGKKVFGSPMSKPDYKEYLASSFNDEAEKEGKEKAFISIDISLAESFGQFSLSVEREWIYREGKVINEKLKLLRNGREFEYVPEEYWGDYLEQIFPSYLGKFFIFDGERVEEFATDPEFQSEIRDSLKDAVGLKSHETLYSDISNLKSKIKRRNIDEDQLKRKIKNENQEKEEKKEKIARIEKEIKDVENEIDQLTRKKEEIESELDRIAGKVSKDLDSKNEKVAELKEKKDKIKQSISDTAGSFLPFVMPKEVSNSLKEQLEHERKIKQKKSSKKFLERINDRFLSSLTSKLEKKKEFGESTIGEVENSVKNTFEEFLDHEENGDIIHDLTRKEISKTQSFINQAKKNVNNGFQEKLENLRKIEQQIDEIQNDLDRATEGNNVRELINKISEIESKKGRLKEKKRNLKENKEGVEKEIEKISSQINKLENEIVCAEVDRRKVNKIQKVQNVIKDVEKQVISSRIDRLEKYISDRYHKLANKDDMVENITVDEKDFTINLFDDDGKKLDKSSLSTGEKEIFAISVLEGLIKISNYDFPVIIDAPLTSLDEEHTDNILSQFVPNISDQVILLSTDREIDEDKYELIKENIHKEFVIEKEGPNKIKEGYFFEQ